VGSATAVTDCRLLQINKEAMLLCMQTRPAFSDMFVAYLLARNIRYQKDLSDQLFDSDERRLARVLLLLANFGKDGKPEAAIQNVSDETLADRASMTLPRVSFFMNRFKRLGFLTCNGSTLQVHSSLLSVVLHD
jgi:CRP/FNR family cyclic AMP-dependent transcriptional regulator